jgi:hypothetical protein
MFTLAIVLNFVGLGIYCWLAFALAAHALPAFVGVTCGLAAFHNGAGTAGAILVGLAAGAISLLAGQFAFVSLRSPLLRAVLATVFFAPAAIAGYHMAFALAEFSGSSPIWREAFALIGALTIGAAAYARLAAYCSSSRLLWASSEPAYPHVPPQSGVTS